MGVSNPHPHCQIYATNFVFKTIETEARVSRDYLREHGRPLFGDIIAAEREDGRRMLYENETAIAFLPYFARYAYEVYVAPKATHASLADLSPAEVADLALALKNVTVRFDNLWQMPFPYVLALHQAPTDGGDYAGFHFHARVPPAPAEARPAEIPGRAGDRRRQLRHRHHPGRKGGRAAGRAGLFTTSK